MANEIEEIKARVDVVDLISEYIKLTQSGTNWKGLCPFHNEKSPSFMASRDKQIWHCFGCSEGGDIFTFVQKMEGMDFADTLKLLAQKAGVKLSNQSSEQTSKKGRLQDICKLAMLYWHKTLLESSQAEHAREYIKKRGLGPDTVAEFKIGYAVDSWDTLSNFLRKRGYTDQEIFLAGLSVKKEGTIRFYDRFRDRLMFVINDVHGNPIGFSGRTLNPNEQGGKYINTPQTDLYNKSLAIFNLDKAKLEIKKKDVAVLVEGQMDCVSAYQAGTKNVIATSGTALTLEQIKILQRYASSVAIAFDEDVAGESAAKRGIELALSQDLRVKVITLPQGKDPDECIRANPDDWFAAVDAPKSIVEYYFEKMIKRVDVSSPEGKRQAAKELVPIILKMPSRIEQTHWIQRLATLLNVPEQILADSVPGLKTRAGRAPQEEARVSPPARPRNRMLIEQSLALVLTHPTHLRWVIDNLPLETVIDNDLKNLYNKLILYYTQDIAGNPTGFTFKAFRDHLVPEQLDILADRLTLMAEHDFFGFNDQKIQEELYNTVLFARKEYYANRLQHLQLAVKEAEKSGNHSQLETLLREFNELVAHVKALDSSTS